MRTARLGMVGVVAIGVWLFTAAAAGAADRVVNCAADNSALGPAINAAAAGDRLLVSGICDGTYEIHKSLTIRGNPTARLDGGNQGSVFQVFNFKTLRLVRVTVTRGSFTVGGGIFSFNPSHVILDRVIIRGNHADSDGGGLAIGGTLRMKRSTVSGNTSGNLGAGISAGGITSPFGTEPGLVTITNSTISGNSARGDGGGIFFDGNPFSIRQSTISNNETRASFGQGGGILALSINPGDTPGVISGSIIADNRSAEGADCFGFNFGVAPFVSGGWNLAGSSCGFSEAGDAVASGNGGLGPLTWNGGPAKTMPLLPGSPAIDRIPVGTKTPGGSRLCPGIDERGIARPQGPACDSGAYELMK